MYQALIPLSGNTDITIEALASQLAARLVQQQQHGEKEYRVNHSPGDHHVSVVAAAQAPGSSGDDGRWSLTVVLSTADWVNAEANELADRHPEWPGSSIVQLRQSNRRLEVSSYGDDAAMNHFNTYLFVLEEIEKFHGVLLKFDPRDGRPI